jgi:hypothetical protein
MTVVTDVTITYNATTHIVTFTVTKQEIVSHPSGHAAPSQPVIEVTTVDLSALIL